jgi:DNA-binding NtrC family response regulator
MDLFYGISTRDRYSAENDSMRQLNILLIEDDSMLGESLSRRLELEKYKIKWIKNGQSVLENFNPEKYDLIICDLRLPKTTGDEIYKHLKLTHKFLPPFILITGYGTITQAVEMLKCGVDDFITKPLDIPYLLKRIKELTRHHETDDSIQLSPGLKGVESIFQRMVPHPELIILILGESGVGKEVCAARLHQLACPDKPFEAVNCAALPEDLVGSELFGHEKGSFTSAISTRLGAFERAQDGIIFLDEIGDMNLDIQAQLLRVLEQRQITRVGGNTPIPVKARIVCATHVDLEQLVHQGEFREDLYFRLKVVTAEVLPLRERPADIIWLAQRFIEANARRVNRENTPQIDEELKQAMLQYDWPGNVRELKNAIDRACIFCDGDHLTSELLGLVKGQGKPASLDETLEQAERNKILRVLANNEYRIKASADELGISRKGLWQKMKRLDIKRT